ncbi:MAG: hypothetical protein ACOZIN_12125 [Myxococcota bacterium]
MSARWFSAWALCAVLFATPVAAKKRRRVKPARPTPATFVARPRSPNTGQVTYLTAERAFLDRGAAEGLVVDQVLRFGRKGKAATCRIDAVSEHSATCEGAGGLKVGDRFAVKEPPRPPPPPILPTPPAPAELARQRVALERAAHELVDFAGGSLFGEGGARGLELSLQHDTYAATTAAQGPYQRERLSLGLAGVEVLPGVRASARLAVTGWARRPDTYRFPTRTLAQLHVYQAELAMRSAERALTFAAGRTWARFAPGLALLDGVQAGWKNDGEDLEVGVYAGALPDWVSLTPSLSRWTVGGYFMTRRTTGGSTPSLWQPEVRVGWVRGEDGDRLELGAALHAFFQRQFDAQAQVLLGVGPGQQGLGVDGVQLDAGGRLSQAWRVRGGVRYVGSDDGRLAAGVFSPRLRGVHADLGADFEPFGWLVMGVRGGGSIDPDTGLGMARLGPELSLPRLLGAAGGISLGYAEEVGWFRGRSGYLHTAVHPLPRTRLMARVSLDEQLAQTGASGLVGRELGSYLGIDLALGASLWVRASFLGRLELES